MNSSCVVTKYSVISRGKLEWKIENVGHLFEKCNECLNGQPHKANFSCPNKDFKTIDCPSIKLAAGAGKYTEWSFNLLKTCGSAFYIGLCLRGFFASDGSPVDEPFTFHYNLTAETSIRNTTEALGNSGKGEYPDSSAIGLVKGVEFKFEQLKSVWPDGKLRATIQISYLSDLVHEVINNDKLFDSTDFNDYFPVPSCYGKLLNNPDLSDFKIICQGSTFHAHKFILSVQSPVFRAMLEAGMSESNENKLEIKEMTLKTVELMLEYIYKGTLETFPDDLKEKIELLDCAEKYELDGLKSICMSKLFSNPPNEKDVGELALAASIYGANKRATKTIKDFCMKNHVKLMQNPEYKKLFLANPQAFVN